MKNILLSTVQKIEVLPITLGTWVTTFAGIVLIRFLIEKLLVDFEGLLFTNALYTYSHYFLEFLFVAIFFLLIIRFAGRGSFEEVANFTLFGFFLIWTPPIVDYLLLHNPGVFSLYEFGTLRELGRSFLTFFDDTPEIGITYGIRFEIALATVIVALYSYLKISHVFRALFAGFLTYLMLFVTSTLPSWLAILLLGPSTGWFSVGERESVELFLSPTPVFGQVTSIINAAHFKMSLVYGAVLPLLLGGILFFFFRQYYSALFKNVRFPQVFYHGGLFLLGGLFAFLYGRPVIIFDLFHTLALFILIASVVCAWLASVVLNDFVDERIDRVTNPQRPLPAESLPRPFYRTFGLLCFAFSFFLPFLIAPAISILLLGYQALAWLYSSPPFRLKRLPGVATGLASAASLLVFFAGYLVFSGDKSLAGLPSQIPLFLFVAYALVIPLKDLKDIAGDRADGVLTLPVLLGETWAKRLIGAFLFLLFVASVFFLRLNSLLPLALFFGSLAYWVLQISALEHRTFSYRALPAWLMALVITYGLFLFFALF